MDTYNQNFMDGVAPEVQEVQNQPGVYHLQSFNQPANNSTFQSTSATNI